MLTTRGWFTLSIPSNPIVIISFIGLTIASIQDIKTTWVNSWIPYSMILIGLINYFINGGLLHGVLVGLMGLSIGLTIRYLANFGGADIEMLTALGFLFPYGFHIILFWLWATITVYILMALALKKEDIALLPAFLIAFALYII